jgi:hypothetical protein
MEFTVNPWRNAMKTQIAATLGLALLAAVSASAQNTETNQIKVPFAFMAGNKILPAAEYRVQVNPSTGVVTLFNPAGAVVSIEAVSDVDRPGHDALEFQCFGDVCVLQQVRVHGYARTLVTSKSEERELAKLNPPSRQILIASTAPGR